MNPKTTKTGRVDEICLRFEYAWKAGENPSIDEYLTKADSEDVHNALLWGLVRVELDYRQQQGEQPSTQEYAEVGIL